MLFSSNDGTKPHEAVKREIEIDREVPKITEIFMPDDLEDMSSLSKVQGGGLVE